MALAERAPGKPLTGRTKPRIAPPTPARSLVKEYEAQANEIGIELIPWQREAARYLTAQGPGDRLLYREFAAIVARQQGKTELLVPLVVMRLRAGRRIMHTAQNRELPREVFGKVADIMAEKYADEVKRAPRGLAIRFANGQEEIEMRNGGSYRLVAPTRGGARGPSNDDVIADELREMEDFDFIDAAKPTLTASRDPQFIYLSNAGTDTSAVLNALRHRADSDPALAYLEWSASPDRAAHDRRGWVEANPSLGSPQIGEAVLRTLEMEHRTAVLEGQLARFETEHLCRWVVTMRERLVDAFAWARCEVAELPAAVRPMMGISMDPSGTRASAAIAWQQGDAIAVRLIFDVTGNPIDPILLGKDMADMALRLRVAEVGFDPLTDADLARYFRKSRKVTGPEFANASARFVTAVLSTKIRWLGCEPVTDDLAWTARKPHDETGTFLAVRAKDERPITASLAAIRAVWLASGPRPAIPKVF